MSLWQVRGPDGWLDCLPNEARLFKLTGRREVRELFTQEDMAIAVQNIQDAGHALTDLRRFIETKWPGVADVPSQEAVLLNGPEAKHEADALIAALNRVADFYEDNEA